jgi:hypothetical protein
MLLSSTATFSIVNTARSLMPMSHAEFRVLLHEQLLDMAATAFGHFSPDEDYRRQATIREVLISSMQSLLNPS